MVTITPRLDGSYAVEMTPGPRYLILTSEQMVELATAIIDGGWIRRDGYVLARPDQ